MRIVEFSNGKYAIEKGIIFKKYYINAYDSWRSKSSSSLYLCLLDRRTCIELFKEKFPKRVKVVK